MKAAVIKQLALSRSRVELETAAAAIRQGQPAGFVVAGDSAGEQLTHVLAAIVVLDYQAGQGCSVQAALRAFSQRVREAIS
jgi:hypothetical protein